MDTNAAPTNESIGTKNTLVQLNFDLMKENAKCTATFALHAMTSLFMLNGAAATAILAKDVVLKGPAILFALGALFAIFALGISYISSISLARDFLFNMGFVQQAIDSQTSALDNPPDRSVYKRTMICMIATYTVAVVSILLFLSGLVCFAYS